MRLHLAPWLLLLAPPLARAQDDYWINTGLDGSQEPGLGEFGPDLGGNVPFSAYDDPSHLLAASWLCTDTSPREQILDRILNLDTLEALLETCTGAPYFLHTLDPSDAATTVSFSSSFSGTTTAWWGDDLEVRGYRVNGGYVQCVYLSSGVHTPPHLLFVNAPAHPSNFSTLGFTPLDQMYATAPAWTDSGNNSYPDVQALRAGDLVVHVHEGVSSDLWNALQRTQEAQYFVRTYFLPSEFGLTAQQVQGALSVVWGGSWGGQMSQWLSMLQPDTYAGGLAGFGCDVGSYIPPGDWSRMMGHFRAGLDLGLLPRILASESLKNFYLPVDLLGVRFDAPGAGLRGWDVALFSLTHRRAYDSSFLKVPVTGSVGTEDHIVNYHWDAGNLADANFQVRYLKNAAHDGDHGVETGKNEFSFADGSEWSSLLAQAALGSQNPLVIPDNDPPASPYPDPYSHTLRHAPCGGPTSATFLTPIDLQTDLPVDTIGQGTNIAMNNSLGVEDLDGDGRLEVFFGNLEGFFHVLELRDVGSANPTLVDEWKSPYLGWGLWAMDRGAGGNVVLGDSLGRLHLVKCLGPDEYTADLHTPGASLDDTLYRGSVPSLYKGNFDPDVPGQETLVLNQFYDWILLDAGGRFLQRLPRDTLALGPGSGAVAHHLYGLPHNGADELVVPAQDGHVWVLRWDGTQLVKEELVPASAFPRPLAFSAVRIKDPTELVLMGRNDTLSPPDRIVRYELDAPHPRLAATAETEQQLLKPVDGGPGTGFGFAVAMTPDRAAVGTRSTGLLADAVYLFSYDSAADQWHPGQRLQPSTGFPGDGFGSAVAMQGDGLVVGAAGGGVAGAGEVYLYRQDPLGLWFEESRVPGPPEPDAGFGRSVALDGDLVLVGAPGADLAGIDAGAATLLRRGGPATVVASLLPPSLAGGAAFGTAVGLARGVAAIGAPGDSLWAAAAGTVHVFRFHGTTWDFEARLDPADAATGDGFGSAVALTGDLLAVGAPLDDDGGPDSGSVYVHRFDGATWILEAKLQGTGVAAGDRFGSAVALDGDVLVVSAPGDDDQGPDSGAAYRFRHDGIAWNQEAKLLLSSGAPQDGFGDGVAVRGDRILVGASRAEVPVPDCGVVGYYAAPTSSVSTDLRFDQGLVFAWNESRTEFYVGSGSHVARYDASSLTLLAEAEVRESDAGVLALQQAVPPSAPQALAAGGEGPGRLGGFGDTTNPDGGEITALAFATSSGFLVGTSRLVVGRSDGRIYLLKPLTLEPARLSDQVFTLPSGEVALPWYSNFTFAHAPACDLYQDRAGASLYVAEFNAPLSQEDAAAGGSPLNRTYRVARFRRGAASFKDGGYQPFALEAQQRAHREIQGLEATLTRTFRYRDADGDGSPEPYFLAETGAVYRDGGTVRQFCTRSVDRSLKEVLPLFAFGGYVFEFFPEADPDSPVNDYSVLTGFDVPRSDLDLYERPGSGGADWFHPKVGSHRYTGQIATPQQSASRFYCGTSMLAVDLPDPQDGDTVKPHIVTGTIGGYVYAIQPGAQASGAPGANNETAATLSYASPDLGWFAMGLDAGILPGTTDGVARIVVGTLLDTGSFEDWAAGDTDRNRGKISLLRPDPATGVLGVEEELTGDDLLGTGQGMGTVCGLKLDDVDADGDLEIWSGDAAGHVYLFAYDPGASAWQTVYRSGDLGTYPGYYNNLFPVKDTTGHTVELMVVSPGYLLAFAVDWSQVP